MYRSFLISGVSALAACLFSSFAAAASVQPADSLPDARILSAAPFNFRADNDIFSRMPGDTSDTNIIKPRDTMRSAGEPRLVEVRLKRQMAL
jgi:hypothetical protein